MGLISRVSSRTYRQFISDKFTKMPKLIDRSKIIDFNKKYFGKLQGECKDIAAKFKKGSPVKTGNSDSDDSDDDDQNSFQFSIGDISEKLPCFVAIGGQSSAKSATLGRIMGLNICPQMDERCTSCVFDFTLIYNPDISLYKVDVTVQGTNKYSKTLDLQKIVCQKELNDVMIREQTEIANMPQYNGFSFYPEIIEIRIESKQIQHSFTVVDTPGLIQVNVTGGDQSGNEAVSQLSGMLKKVCSERRPNYLVVQDATQNIDCSDALAFLEKNQIGTKDNTWMVLTKCDRLQQEQLDSKKLDGFLTGKILKENNNIDKNKILAVVNRTSVSPQPLNNDAEMRWFKQHCSSENLSHVGAGSIQSLIVQETTSGFMENSLAPFKAEASKLLKKYKREHDKLLKMIETEDNHPTKILQKVYDDLDFIRGINFNSTPDPHLTKLKSQAMIAYGADLEAVRKFLFEQHIEVAMNDYPGEQTQYNEIDLRCQKFSGAVTGPSGDVLIFEKIFDIVCQDIVKRIHEDATRIDHLDKFLNLMRELLHTVANRHTESMPLFNKWLTGVFDGYQDAVEEEFRKFNNAYFDLYHKVTPYNLLTKNTNEGQPLQLKKLADGTAITELNQALDPISNQLEIYIAAFLDLYELNMDFNDMTHDPASKYDEKEFMKKQNQIDHEDRINELAQLQDQLANFIKEAEEAQRVYATL